MTAAATLITDGSPEAEALAQWIRERAGGIAQVDAQTAGAVRAIADARRAASRRERLAVLAEESGGVGDLDGGPALEVVRDWLEELGPFEVRTEGAARIEEAVRAQQEGETEVLALLRRVTSATVPKAATSRKRGRPKGDKRPFRGAGFDVCLSLLRQPERAFTERAMAEEVGRSHYAVHRVLQELDRQGYLQRGKGGTRLAKRDALRDAVVADWSTRLGTPREARHFAPPPRFDETLALKVIANAGHEPVLAGSSALPLGRGLVGAPLTIYADPQVDEYLEGVGFRPLRSRGGRLRLWPVLQWTLISATVQLGDWQATDRVVTSIDLLASADDRERQLGLELWSEA